MLFAHGRGRRLHYIFYYINAVEILVLAVLPQDWLPEVAHDHMVDSVDAQLFSAENTSNSIKFRQGIVKMLGNSLGLVISKIYCYR